MKPRSRPFKADGSVPYGCNWLAVDIKDRLCVETEKTLLKRIF